MATTQSNKNIVVTGDVTMDWNLARTRRSKVEQFFWSAEDQTSASWQRGGAALLADLMEAVTGRLEKDGLGHFSICQTGAAGASTRPLPDNTKYNHSYAMWTPHKYGEKAPLDREKPAWRVEEFLGLDLSAGESLQEWQKVVEDTEDADLIILDDANLGFRRNRELWPLAIQSKAQKQPWILLKMAKPLAQGPLWEYLHKEWSDRLILVATVNDLRLSEVQISRGISWERTAQDVFWELTHNPCANGLSHCAHVIISFGTAGAMLLSRKKKGFDCWLLFDPKVTEGMWEQNHAGGMVGYNTCLTAGVAQQLILSPGNPDIIDGIQRGLAALRTLHLEGYGERGTARTQLVFPIEKIVNKLAEELRLFSVAPVQDPMRFIYEKAKIAEKPLTEGFWTILQDHYQNGLELLAEQIVREGPESSLQDVPWGQFGNLLTVDRQEIESYRSIRNLVAEYAGQKQPPRPLSIAVFGTPGSGKSFGVTQMAKSLLPGQIEPITFNLSQFDSPNDLLSAFHQVRDYGLTGLIPLVFWDEFDTVWKDRPLGWLRYFLAPMQDGKFQEGQVNHPIGRAIFVFAGGTSASMSEFNKVDDPAFKAAKGPDFVSRLKGYINVLGPNPVKGDKPDPYYIIRRAILLRSTLQRNAPAIMQKQNGKDKLNIDSGVLRALLRISDYKHGARSIESIIAMSQLTGETVFERSCLPPEAQLDLHVNGRIFLALVQKLELEGQTLEDLAEAAHQVFKTGMEKRDYTYSAEANEETGTHGALIPYQDLPEELKEANRLNVRDIPAKLDTIGYVMTPARSNERDFNFPGKDLEKLAIAEHKRWVQSKLEDGWKYAPKTNRAKKQHDCLVSWKDLPEEQREKDRDLVRGIPVILAKAGYAIVKI
jgi:hypothetical protein